MLPAMVKGARGGDDAVWGEQTLKHLCGCQCFGTECFAVWQDFGTAAFQVLIVWEINSLSVDGAGWRVLLLDFIMKESVVPVEQAANNSV